MAFLDTECVAFYINYNCPSLGGVTLSNSVTDLGWRCFEGCTSLKEVTCLAETPPSTYNSFEDEAQKTLYVPEASVEAYKTSSYDWSNFGKILPLCANGIKAVNKGDIGMSVDNDTLTLSNVPSDERPLASIPPPASCSARARATSASTHKAHRWSS